MAARDKRSSLFARSIDESEKKFIGLSACVYSWKMIFIFLFLKLRKFFFCQLRQFDDAIWLRLKWSLFLLFCVCLSVCLALLTFIPHLEAISHNLNIVDKYMKHLYVK
jgi:hypothetical protein